MKAGFYFDSFTRVPWLVHVCIMLPLNVCIRDMEEASWRWMSVCVAVCVAVGVAVCIAVGVAVCVAVCVAVSASWVCVAVSSSWRWMPEWVIKNHFHISRCGSDKSTLNELNLWGWMGNTYLLQRQPASCTFPASFTSRDYMSWLIQPHLETWKRQVDIEWVLQICALDAFCVWKFNRLVLLLLEFVYVDVSSMPHSRDEYLLKLNSGLSLKFVFMLHSVCCVVCLCYIFPVF